MVGAAVGDVVGVVVAQSGSSKRPVVWHNPEPLKARSPMVVTLAGSVSSPLSPVQLLKAFVPMVVTLGGMLRSPLSPEHLKKACTPIVVTLVGIASSPVKPVHPEKCHMSAKEALFADTVGRFWSSLAADSPQARDFVWPAYQNTTDMALVLQPGGFSMAHGWRHEACSVLKGYSPWRL